MIQQQINKTQIEQAFDALAFEEERYQIFQQTEQTYQAAEVSSAVLSSTPAPLSDSALDADWDARLGFEPTAKQWHDPNYRQGYLDGIAQKYDEKFGDLV